MCAGLRPARGLSCCFHRVSNVFPVPEWSFAEQLAVDARDLDTVPRVWACLFPANVQLDGSVDSEPSRLLSVIGVVFCSRRRRQCGCILKPDGLQIFHKALTSAFAPVAAFAVSAEPA